MAQIDKPNLHMNTVFYTGNNTSQSVTGVGFQPSWVWLKERNGTEAHNLYDSVRGIYKRLSSDTTGAEYSSNTQLTSFDSDGFSVGSSDAINDTGNSMVGWNWKAGGTAVSNTDGTITSSVSANTTSGFSIVSYSGNSTAGATVGHGLSTAPKMIIIKNLGVENWEVYHEGIGNTKGIYFNEADASFPTSARWNNTSPTNSVWTMGSTTAVNGTGVNYIAYCFTEKKGYSKFGTYVGNGNADGTFVYTGFKPAFYMYKRTDSTSNWTIFDNKRNTFNEMGLQLHPNLSNAESFSSRGDFLSNGFKVRATAGSTNAAGGNYIYMAFAENPLVGTNGIPATAR
tara:strand:+ start:758 stop:1780 length:1023 start_codon:yes stop_codon:yes gene_type:complete